MRRAAAAFLLLACLSTGCAPTRPSTPLFIYLRLDSPDTLRLVLQPGPGTNDGAVTFPVAVPGGCSFWALTPAPQARYAAVEWQCADGPAVQVVDLQTGRAQFLLDDPTLDDRLLSWAPDGESVYLKAGTLSNPQVLRVEVVLRRAAALPLSPNTYNLTVSPDGATLLYALSGGIGLGSEVWAADAQGGGAHRLLSDGASILGLMRYSPDGRHIAYIRLPDDQTSFPAGELWLANADGSHARRVATADAGRGMPPVWSPDGKQIAFIGRSQPGDPNSANLSIYDTATAQLVASPYAPAFPPAWSPDGDKLSITLDRDGKMELWFYEILNGKAEEWLSSACCAGWVY